ncbi:hypothetical protein BJX76DRAFT_356009 [Aspergillus varians]
METISQAVHSASNAIWNEVDALRGGQHQTTETTEQPASQQHGEEPISGIQGKGTVDDPYDAGNRDEQPGAPVSQENTADTTEPLPTIPSTGTGSFHDKYRRPSTKTTLVTSGIEGPTNPTVQQPTPVLGEGLAAKSTLKDEPISTHKSTLKDESISAAGPAPDEPEFTTTSKPSAAAAAAAASTTGLASGSTSGSATERPLEQRSQPFTSETQSTGQEGSGESTSAVDTEAAAETAAHKKGISEEALRGPKCPPPRQSYERQMKSAGGGEEGGESKTSKPAGNSGNKNAHSEESHHRGVKEKLSHMLHHH